MLRRSVEWAATGKMLQQIYFVAAGRTHIVRLDAETGDVVERLPVSVAISRE